MTLMVYEPWAPFPNWEPAGTGVMGSEEMSMLFVPGLNLNVVQVG